jgi:enoyl-CoA hydratase/carnithine racemase/NAD(P)-dependent dehydrogenase (short-subunit alcohol dehydrogenase family)/acyl carrier protein
MNLPIRRAAQKISARFVIRDNNPLVSEHRVHDVHVMPGVTFFDMVMKALAGARIGLSLLTIRDVVFYEPVITSKEVERQVSVTLTNAGDDVFRITASSIPIVRGNPVDAPTKHMTAELRLGGPLALPGALDGTLGHEAAVDLDECYRATDCVGIHHDDFMKCSGTVVEARDGGCLARIKLGERAWQKASNFTIHPVLLDCSTIVPLFFARHSLDQARLYIPFAIREFVLFELPKTRDVLVEVERADAFTTDREVIHRDFTLRALDGRPLIAVRGFAVKRVRSLDGLRPYGATKTVAPIAIARPVVEVAKADDPYLELIGEMIVRFGKVDWAPGDADKEFFALGLDSLSLLDIAGGLEKRLNIQLYPTLLFEQPTPRALAGHLARTYPSAFEGTPVAEAPPVVENPVQMFASRWLPAEPNLAGQVERATAILAIGNTFGLASSLPESIATLAGDPPSDEALAEHAASVRESEGPLDVYLIVGDRRGSVEAHDLVFRWVKSLVAGTVPAMTIRLVTFDGEAHGVWGLLMSLSREHPQIAVASFELDRQGDLGSWAGFVSAPVVSTRQRLGQRSGAVAAPHLVPLVREASPATRFRTRGTYVIIGGGRGVGYELAKYLRARYDAKIAIIGRSPHVEAIGALGDDVAYHALSVTDAGALAEALASIEAQMGPIHGIVHSAMVLDDRRLAEMSEDSFARVTAPKVAGARALAAATEGRALDFLLFFSSVQSLIGNLGQANYAAASTFMDGLAGDLARTRPYPVVTVNWGYWGDVGAVASEHYRDLMRRMGMHGLTAPEAFEALEFVLGTGLEQSVIVRADDHVLREMGAIDGLTLSMRAGDGRFDDAGCVIEPALAEEGARVISAAADYLEELLPVARRHIALALREVEGKVVPEHERLHRAIVACLAKEGNEPSGDLPSLTSIADRHPHGRGLGELLARCVGAYPALLSGKMLGMDVMFPQGSTALVRAVYGDDPVSHFYNRVVAAVVSRALAGRGPVRILEIGAGTGGTTRQVLAALRQANVAVEYAVTDLWDRLITEVKNELGAIEGVTFRCLDIGHDPKIQGFSGDYDIVIATNVLHATRDVRASLHNAKKLLKAGGALILNESTEVQEFSTYTFGTLRGWWHASDSALRLPASPLVDARTWLELLSAEGYRATEVALPPGPQSVFVAVSDGAVLERTTAAVRTEDEGRVPPDSVRLFETRFRHVEIYRDARDNGWVLLHNPPGNMFTAEVTLELCEAFDALSEMRGRGELSRFVFLSHRGSYFSLGGDRDYLLRHVREGNRELIARFVANVHRLAHTMMTMDAVVVAVAHGPVQGGALEMLFGTDFQVLARGVKVGLPEVKSGLIPGMGGLSFLKRQVGMTNAKRLAMLGDLITAEEAQRLGLVSHVVDDALKAARLLEEDFPNVDAALAMKAILNGDSLDLLNADLEAWHHYVTTAVQSIDAKRIANSRTILRTHPTR